MTHRTSGPNKTDSGGDTYLVLLHDDWMKYLNAMIDSGAASKTDASESMFSVGLMAILANDGHRETARRLHLLSKQLLEMGDAMAKNEGGDARTRH